MDNDVVNTNIIILFNIIVKLTRFSFSGKAGAAAVSVSSRLFTSGTASSRAKTADKSGNTSPQEKTGNMLKNTLRKMTRFSIGSNGKKKESTEEFAKPAPPEPSEPKSRTSRSAFIGKSRVPKSQSPAPGGTNVARSKSFKEPGVPVATNRPGSGGTAGLGYSGASGLTRNNVYTSSLRRTKMKHQVNLDDKDEKDSGSKPSGMFRIYCKMPTNSIFG